MVKLVLPKKNNKHYWMKYIKKAMMMLDLIIGNLHIGIIVEILLLLHLI